MPIEEVVVQTEDGDTSIKTSSHRFTLIAKEGFNRKVKSLKALMRKYPKLKYL